MSNRNVLLLKSATLLILVCLVFSETLISTFRLWSNDNDYHHGFLISLAILYILYEDRSQIRSLLNNQDPKFLALTFLLSSGWFVANFLGLQVIEQAILPLILWTAIGYIGGTKLFKYTGLFVALLLLTVPIWEYSASLLQFITTTTVGFMLEIVDIPAYISGFIVEIPVGRFAVAEGCAGIRYLTTALAVAFIYNRWFVYKVRDKLVILSLLIFLSLVSNWIRVFIIVVVGYKTDMQSSLIEDHNDLGWYVFSVVLIIFFILAKRIVDTKPPANSEQNAERFSFVLPGKHFIFALLAAFAVPVSGSIYERHLASQFELSLDAPDLKGWVKTESRSASWTPYYLDASAEHHFSYGNARGTKTDLFVYMYNEAKPGSGELVNYHNALVNKEEWIIESQEAIELPLANSGQFSGYKSKLYNRETQQNKLIFSSYLVENRFTRSGKVAKLLKLRQFWGELFYPPALIVIAVDCRRSCTEELEDLTEFAATTASELISRN